jgi:hypothetical protein
MNLVREYAAGIAWKQTLANLGGRRMLVDLC